MARPIPELLVLSAVLICLAGPAAAQDAEAKRTCKKKLAAMGYPHRLETIAQINAIRTWSNGSKKHGRDFARWYYAKGGSIKCEKLERSDYYRCTATGRPCLPPRQASAQAE